MSKSLAAGRGVVKYALGLPGWRDNVQPLVRVARIVCVVRLGKRRRRSASGEVEVTAFQRLQDVGALGTVAETGAHGAAYTAAGPIGGIGELRWRRLRRTGPRFGCPGC